jgi:uncharacterized delta-60 repeat protein
MLTRILNWSGIGSSGANSNATVDCKPLMLCSLMLHAGAALAQSPGPLALPNLHLTTNGSVYAIAKRSDGGIVIGGAFSEINGISRFNIARLDATGTLDETWAPTMDGIVTVLTVDAEDSVYAAGNFSKVNDEYRFGLAKISGVGQGNLVSVWHSLESATIRSLVTDGNGSLFIGGSFVAGSSIDGRYLENFVKASCATGQLDRNWNPEIGSIVAVAYDGSGHLVASGESTSLARVSTTGNGEVDSTWMPAYEYSQVSAIVVAADHSVFVGGRFCPASDPFACVSLAKISESGVVDASWRPSLPILEGSGAWVHALRIDNAGNLLVAGLYGNSSVPLLARMSIEGHGLIDATWAPDPDAITHDMAVNPDGSIFLGGEFSRLGTMPRKGLARIAPNGQADLPRMDATFPGIVNAITVFQDGRAVVGGEFEYVDGAQVWTNLLRLNSDGSLDPDWNPHADGIVRSLVSDAAQNVYVGGSFTHIGGQLRRALAKLPAAANGGADPGWDPSPGVGLEGIGISAIALSPQGQLFVGGDFSGSIGGQTQRYGLAKLSAATGLADPDWLPLYARPVQSIAIGPDGSVYVAGDFFFFVNNPSRAHIAKISGTGRGVVDPFWAPSLDAPLTSIVVDSNSNVFVAGSFDQIDGQNRYRLAKLIGPTGAVDPNWSHTLYATVGGLPLTDASERTAVLALDSDEHLYFGGMFGAIDGVAAPYLARLETEGSGHVDSAWNPSTQIDFRNGGSDPQSGSYWFPPIRAIAFRPDGAVLVGGDFYGVGGFMRNGLAAIPPAPLPNSIFPLGSTRINPRFYRCGSHCTFTTGASGAPGRTMQPDPKLHRLPETELAQ